jgi:hypothetical protein
MSFEASRLRPRGRDLNPEGEACELVRSDVNHSYLLVYLGSEAGFYDEESEEMRR